MSLPAGLACMLLTALHLFFLHLHINEEFVWMRFSLSTNTEQIPFLNIPVHVWTSYKTNNVM